MIFNQACGMDGERVGDGGYLRSMIKLPNVVLLLDEYAMHFGSWLDRQQILQLVMLLNRVVTPIQSEIEAKARKDEMARMELEAKTKRGRR